MDFFTAAFILVILWLLYGKISSAIRAQRINEYVFPPSVQSKVLEVYPHLSPAGAQRVVEGLREYFHLCNEADSKLVAMPSRAVDVAWHELILFTKKYEEFCKRCLGKFLHHTPAEAMKSATQAQDAVKTAWRIACMREEIDREAPESLPTIFALDRDLHIPDGFHYELDCLRNPGTGHCASHIDCSGDCAGGSDSGDSGCSSCGGD